MKLKIEIVKKIRSAQHCTAGIPSPPGIKTVLNLLYYSWHCVRVYVPYKRPNGWADQDQTRHVIHVDPENALGN